MGSRRWSIGSVAGLLLSGGASTAELSGAGPGLAAGCEEVERSVVGLDEAPAGLDATAAEWLARAEGEWSGELGRRRVTTAVSSAGSMVRTHTPCASDARSLSGASAWAS